MSNYDPPPVESLLDAMWESADKAALGAGVELLPWADAVGLLPPDPSPA